jgi:hypothetical protein
MTSSWLESNAVIQLSLSLSFVGQELSIAKQAR